MSGRKPRLEDVFRPGGLLDRQLENYEFRPAQLAMAEAVDEAVGGRHHLCVEAGTGTGKTLAYLIPAVLSGKRALVSTATRNLQDQIFHKDLPFLRRHLVPSLSATYLKGRQNYLCLRRYQEERRQLVFSGFQPDAIGWLDQWLKETQTGDRAELPWLSDDQTWWDRVDARSDTCSGQKCQYFEDCFVTRMRQQAYSADVVVINHALFFANLVLEIDEIGRILPDYGVLILDEAHELEDIAAEHFGRRISNYQLEDLARTLAKAPGSDPLTRAVQRLETAGFRLFAALPPEEGRFSLTRYRIHGGQVVDLREELAGAADELLRQLTLLYQMLRVDLAEWEAAEPTGRRILRHVETLQALIAAYEPGTVYWFERSGRGAFIHLSPIDVAPILKEELFDETDTVVMTSATLTVDGSFEYFRRRVGAEPALELLVPGEFDFSRQAVLYVPRHTPDPRASFGGTDLIPEFEALLKLTDGHAFLLFTSFQMLDRVYAGLAAASEYPLLRQGEKPKQVLLEEFRSTPRAVLCAAASFWQGVDVQGDALRLVVVDKLPFRVPTEPLVSARVERLEHLGLNGFQNYSLPAAIIALRQGLGRLIRSRRDTGILAVLDSRLWTKNYGQVFFKSLPNCPVTDNMKNLENLFRQIGSRYSDS
jgi:ATP-dependent DNA helicase DinG